MVLRLKLEQINDVPLEDLIKNGIILNIIV